MKKIYLIGGWSYGNIGDEAILEGLLIGIKDIYKDANIAISSYDPSFTERFHKDVIGVVSQANLQRVRQDNMQEEKLS